MISAAFGELRLAELDDIIPWQAGLSDAISLSKGCYLGQETVARVHSQGHMNYQLVGLRLEGAQVPQPKAEINREGKTVGRVTSAVPSAALDCPIALAYLRNVHCSPGTEVKVSNDNGEISAEVHDLPFIPKT